MTAQQGTPEWFAERIGYCTASKFSSVIARGEGRSRKTYLTQLVCERLNNKATEGFSSKHTDHRCTDGEMVLFYSKSTVAFKVFPFRQDGKPVSTYSLQPTRTTTGTTSVELSNIVPSWATKLYVNIMEMSLNGPHNPTIQLKDVAYKTSGYQGGTMNITTLAQRVTVFPTGVGFFSNTGLNLWRGVITFNLMDNATNTWGYTGNLFNSNNRVYGSPSGIVSLSSRVTGVRLISSGSNTFDQMKASVAWT